MKNKEISLCIAKISDLETVFALKRLCTYVVDFACQHSVDNDEFGAELNLAVARSKRHEEDVKTLATLDSDLTWGTTKHRVSDNATIIKKSGDFNPWYQGQLTLEELLGSLQDLAELVSSWGLNDMGEAEFVHYYDFLYRKLPQRPALQIRTKKTATQITIDSLHPKILEASRKLYVDKHYSSAILEAYKAVFNELKQLTGIRNLDGKKLAEKVFAIENPVIKLSALETESEQDEQKGFMLLLAGAALGIRNPKAHDMIVQKDPRRTLEYLSFASLLLSRIDENVEINTEALQAPTKNTPQVQNKPHKQVAEPPYVYLKCSFGGNGVSLNMSIGQTFNLSERFIFLEKMNILGRTIKFDDSLVKAGDSLHHTGIDGLEYPDSDKDQFLEIYFHSKNAEQYVARQKLKLQPRQDGKFNIAGLDNPTVKAVK